MNRQEFNVWLDEYLTAFPQTREWLAKLDENKDGAERAQATLRTWSKTLAGIAAIHVTTATERIIEGKLASVPAYERDKTALHIRGYAARIADDDRKKQIQAKVRKDIVPRSGEAYPAGKLSRLAAKIWQEGRDCGLPDEEIRDQVSVQLDEYLDEYLQRTEG